MAYNPPPPKPKHTTSVPPAQAQSNSLYSRYMRLPLKLRLYIWISTGIVAYFADSISDKIFQQNMIEVEAERRVELEIAKQREIEFKENLGNK